MSRFHPRIHALAPKAVTAEANPALLPARRRCLKCSLDFESISAANRICPSCAESNRRCGNMAFDPDSIIFTREESA